MKTKCDLTGKSKMTGHNISESYRHTKRVFKPNIQKKTFILNDKKVTMHLSTSAIRTLRKKGVL